MTRRSAFCFLVINKKKKKVFITSTVRRQQGQGAAVPIGAAPEKFAEVFLAGELGVSTCGSAENPNIFRQVWVLGC